MRELVDSYVIDGDRHEKVIINIPHKITRDKKEKKYRDEENEKGLSGRLQ